MRSDHVICPVVPTRGGIFYYARLGSGGGKKTQEKSRMASTEVSVGLRVVRRDFILSLVDSWIYWKVRG